MTDGPGGGAGPDASGRNAVGAWLFRNRGWLPVPLLLGMVVSPVVAPVPGAVLVAAGEGLRLWAVGHIGLPSRTRGDGAHRVVETGPYARVRNPLYVGNLLIFVGLGVMTWPWALAVGPLLAVHYHHIVAWEESNLAVKLGEPYLAYLRRVPRWLPRGGGDRPGASGGGRWDGRRALRSERTTLLVLGATLGAMALWPR